MKKHSKYFSPKNFLFYQLLISCQCRQPLHTISKSSHLTCMYKDKKNYARGCGLKMFIKSTWLLKDPINNFHCFIYHSFPQLGIDDFLQFFFQYSQYNFTCHTKIMYLNYWMRYTGYLSWYQGHSDLQ